MDPSKGVDLSKKREEEALICPHCGGGSTAEEREKYRQERLALKKEDELKNQFNDLFKDKISKLEKRINIVRMLSLALPILSYFIIWSWLVFQPREVYLKYHPYFFVGTFVSIILLGILSIFIAKQIDKKIKQAFQKFKEGWPMEAYKW